MLVRLVCAPVTLKQLTDFDFIINLLSSIFHHFFLVFLPPLSSLRNVPGVVWSPLGRDHCSLSHIDLISLSLVVQREGAQEPLILWRHSVQGGRNRGANGMGGCHHCSGTSKDSSADVSKQDGCQVNYLCNKNRLVFMLHTRVVHNFCLIQRAVDVFSWCLNSLRAF